MTADYRLGANNAWLLSPNDSSNFMNINSNGNANNNNASNTNVPAARFPMRPRNNALVSPKPKTVSVSLQKGRSSRLGRQI